MTEDAETGCVVWRGRVDRDGYPRFREGGRDVAAHRWSWRQATGRDVPAGHVVRHTCHRPGCVNPDHLLVGTAADNVGDRQAADRQAKGSGNGRARLTEGQVSALKRVLDDGAVPAARLARLLGVDRATVRDIGRGRTWGHVLPEGSGPASGGGEGE